MRLNIFKRRILHTCHCAFFFIMMMYVLCCRMYKLCFYLFTSWEVLMYLNVVNELLQNIHPMVHVLYSFLRIWMNMYVLDFLYRNLTLHCHNLFLTDHELFTWLLHDLLLISEVCVWIEYDKVFLCCWLIFSSPELFWSKSVCV